MNILAIDTIGEYLSLGLATDDNNYYDIQKIGRNQSQQILTKINILLSEAKICSNDLNYIALNIGPGSFTSLRVGASVALALAWAIDCKIIVVNSFQIIVDQYFNHYNCFESNLLVALDARLGQIYLCALDITGQYLLAPQLVTLNELNQFVAKVIGDKVNYKIVGSGAHNYYQQLNEQAKILLLPELNYPDAQIMLNYAQKHYSQAIAPNLVEIMYLRNKVALTANEQKNNAKK